MKRNFGKIMALGAAMLVTVPMAVALSACDSEAEHKATDAWQTDANNHWHACLEKDEHQYNLGEHTWKINNETYTCTVCDYTKIVAGANDQHIQTLQAAWQNVAENCSEITMVADNIIDDFDYGSVIISYDRQKGIGYYIRPAETAKIFQEDDRYIACLISPDEDNQYRLVDQSFVKKLFEEDFSSPLTMDLSPVFDGTLDSETFLAHMKTSFGECKSAEVNYTIVDDVLTVTVSADRITSYKSDTVVTQFVVKNGVLTNWIVRIRLVNHQDSVNCMNYQINYNVFDQAGFDQIDVGELPENIEPYNPEA